MLKKFSCLLLAIMLIGSMGITSVAAYEKGEDNAQTISSEEESPRYVNPYFYEYVKNSTSYEWSVYKRVSDNIHTGSAGGSISCTQSVSFSANVTGNVYGISIDVGNTLSSTIGYTLNAGPNVTVYMAYRVKYEIETGTRYVYDAETGKLVSQNPVTIERPLYGEYKLLNG